MRIIVADCTVDYEGRLNAHLPRARRLIVVKADGTVLVCSHTQTPVFDRYFSSWEVVEHKCWNPAFNLAGDILLECEQAPNLYLVGDHNICGLEDAYITGLYAANRIAESSGVHSRTEQRMIWTTRSLPNST